MDSENVLSLSARDVCENFLHLDVFKSQHSHSLEISRIKY